MPSIATQSQIRGPQRFSMNGGYPLRPVAPARTRPLAGLVGQPAAANGRRLASGPWQSSGFGPPTCRLRQLALERSHHAQYRSDRLCPVVAGGLRQIRRSGAQGHRSPVTHCSLRCASLDTRYPSADMGGLAARAVRLASWPDGSLWADAGGSRKLAGGSVGANMAGLGARRIGVVVLSGCAPARIPAGFLTWNHRLPGWEGSTRSRRSWGTWPSRLPA